MKNRGSWFTKRLRKRTLTIQTFTTEEAVPGIGNCANNTNWQTDGVNAYHRQCPKMEEEEEFGTCLQTEREKKSSLILFTDKITFTYK